MTKLRFRPHHFLCSLGFQGKGYSDGFTANMDAIVNGRLRADGGDQVEIEVIRHTDDICCPCPKRIDTKCQNQEGIEALDRQHLTALDLRYGQTLTWGEAEATIRRKVRPRDLNTICAGCQWLSYGLCETALRDLHDRLDLEDDGVRPLAPSSQKAAQEQAK